MSRPDPYALSATAALALLERGEVSPLELVDAAAARIDATDAQINAMPTRCFERARERARAITDGRAGSGLLRGLPVAIKDLTEVAGVRTTFGSPIYRDHVPTRSDILVERLEARGAVVVGKTNTPEFGAGASTFNEVFGVTRNPWNVEKSAAGSSGGSAAALAAGQVWLATGSDLGGSLRTPASFNGVVGLRPSPGRVARTPGAMAWDSLSVDGPMARTVADCALLLDALAGHHPEDPISLAAPAEPFRNAVVDPQAPARIAYGAGLGILPVDDEVAALCETAAFAFAEHGTAVERACPDLGAAPATFQTLRAALFAAAHQDHLRDHRDKLKPELIWNIEKGLALSAADIGRAEQTRARLYRDVVAFFERFELLLCPAAIVPPFDAERRYVEAVGEHRFDSYIDWIGITSALTLSGCPVIAVPAGITRAGLPVGLQIMGPPRGEAEVLAAAALLERTLGLHRRLPLDPRIGSPAERLA